MKACNEKASDGTQQSSQTCLDTDTGAISKHIVKKEGGRQSCQTENSHNAFSASSSSSSRDIQDVIEELIVDTVLAKGMPLASGKVLKQILLNCVSTIISADKYPISVKRSLLKYIANADVSTRAIRKHNIMYGVEHRGTIRTLIHNAVACSASYNLVGNPAVLSHMITHVSAVLPMGKIQTLACGISGFNENNHETIFKDIFLSSLGIDDKNTDDELCKILLKKLVGITINLKVSATMNPSESGDNVACSLYDLSNKRPVLYMTCLLQWQNKIFETLCEEYFSDVIEVVHRLTIKISNMPAPMKNQFRSFLGKGEDSIVNPSAIDKSIEPECNQSTCSTILDGEVISKNSLSKIDTELQLRPALRLYITMRWTYLHSNILSFYENLEQLTLFINQHPSGTSIISECLATRPTNPAWIRRLALLADLLQICTRFRLLMDGPHIIPGQVLLEMCRVRDTLRGALADLLRGIYVDLPRLAARLGGGGALPAEEVRPLLGALEALVGELGACLSAYQQPLPLLRLSVRPEPVPEARLSDMLESCPVPGVDRGRFATEYQRFSSGEQGEARRRHLERVCSMACNTMRWKALVAFWAGQQAAYPQTGRVALALLTVFATVGAPETSRSAVRRR